MLHIDFILRKNNSELNPLKIFMDNYMSLILISLRNIVLLLFQKLIKPSIILNSVYISFYNV